MNIKFKKRICGTVLSILLVSNFAVYAEESYFSGGKGTAEDPYLISTADDLVQLNTLSNSNADGINSAFYKLTENIDMTGKIYDGLGASAPDNSWAGLFKGTIDGDYHVISNLEISNEEGKKSVSNDFAKGFIALSEGATVKNLGIDGLNVTTAGRAGGLIAFISGDTTVENCFVRNAVITGNKSGGIIGDVQAGKTVVVKDCYVIANVGLIGQNSSYETTTMERVYCGNDKGQFSQLPGTCKYAYRFRDASTPVTCWNDGEYKNSGITLEEALTNLGAAFAEDTMNQNSGYPVLAWENEKTTENGVLKVKSFDVSKTPDNEIQGTFLLKNYNIESKTAVIAIVLYGDDEEMLAVKIFESKNIPSGKSESAEVVFNGNEKAKKASLFVWDSLSEVNEIEYVRKDIEE